MQNGLDTLYDSIQRELAEKGLENISEKALLTLNLLEIRRIRTDLRQPFWSTWQRRQVFFLVTGAATVLAAGNAGASTILPYVLKLWQ